MKLPSHARLAFKGEIFEVHQWPQKMYDGSTATFEMLKRPDSAIILPTMGGKLLYGLEEQPPDRQFLGLFGGRVEEGEDALTAAKRELLEETGLVSDEWVLFRTYRPSHKIEWTLHFFIARDCRKAQEPHHDAGERIVVKETTLDGFYDLLLRDDMREKEIALDLLRLKMKGKKHEFEEKLFKL